MDLPRFDRRLSGAELPFSRIGGGAIGGKATGLVRARDVLAARFSPDANPRVEIPVFTVIGTEVFERFTTANGLREDELAELADDRIAHRFQQADMPVEFLGDLRALASRRTSPLAVRSSSLLEDAYARPFAGVFLTKMLPNDSPDPAVRFRRLVEAVKLVYASAFLRDAREYRRVVGIGGDEERMAVIVQDVVGTRHGWRFYPLLSAVARSVNFYPIGANRPESGIVHLALGLGKAIVDGGATWSFSPARPKAPPPFASPKDLLDGTQLRFWAIRIGPPPEVDPTREDEFLAEGDLADAEADGVLRHVASTFDGGSGRFVPGTGIPGPRVLDFAPMLTLGQVPVARTVKDLLVAFEEELDEEVEIELAMSLERDGRSRLGFLQVRPLVVSDESVEISEKDLEGPDVVLATRLCCGHGEEEVGDVVYVVPETFHARHTREIADEIQRFDAALSAERRPYALLGFGRWGSSDPWLGVPVVWSQIAGARALAEIATEDLNVEPSQGSHFFHNISSFGVRLFHVPVSAPVDWTWLGAQPVVGEGRFVRHVRPRRPVRIRVDGRSGRGGLWRTPAGDAPETEEEP